jgi:predicted dehydrogenase
VGRVTIFGKDREAEVWMPSLIGDRLDLGSTTQAAVAAFVDSIRDGKTVPIPGSDGLNRLRLEVALLKSAQENRPVRL